MYGIYMEATTETNRPAPFVPTRESVAASRARWGNDRPATSRHWDDDGVDAAKDNGTWGRGR